MAIVTSTVDEAVAETVSTADKILAGHGKHETGNL